SRGGLRFLRGLNLDPRLTSDLVLEPGEGIAGRAFQERRPAWARDQLADPPLPDAPAADELGPTLPPRAHPPVPLVRRRQPHGAPRAYFFTPHDLTAKEIQLLTTLADHAAIAIEHAKLYEEAETQRTRLRLIFDSPSDGILLLGRDGRIEAAN